MRNSDYRFDVQLREGLAAEGWFYELTCGGDRFEVKHDHRALETGNLYVEEEHDPGRRGEWKPSGITTTEAHAWIFVLGTVAPVSFVGVEVGALKRLASTTTRYGNQPFGSCPTRGALVRLTDVLAGGYSEAAAA